MHFHKFVQNHGAWRRWVAAALMLAMSPLTAARPVAQPRPQVGSLEYRLSWGAGASRADRAYRAGATGEGVTVAMIDTGLVPEARALFRNLSPASIDLLPNRGHEVGDRHHGGQTASVLAAALDGHGTFGIAYGATLLSIRADRDGSCERVCAFDPGDLARAVDYAVEHGARVIGLPLASKRPIPMMEAALERAVKAGAVIVASAGNDGAADPTWPARYAADPRFAASMIVAGASDYRGGLARWSNKAGAAADRFMTAPGSNVVVDCGDRMCKLVSGTSYSVSYVAGALALLLSRSPDLSGAQAAELLLNAARSHTGIGPEVAGRGRLDVARAMRLLEEAHG